MLLHPSIPGLYYYFHTRTASVTGDGACLLGRSVPRHASYTLFFHPLIPSLVAVVPIPSRPSQTVPGSDLCALYYCPVHLALRHLELLLCISPLHDIHSDLDWRLFLHTGMFEYKYIMWPWEPKLGCQLPECLACNPRWCHEESSCGLGNCCLSSDQFCFLIPPRMESSSIVCKCPGISKLQPNQPPEMRCVWSHSTHVHVGGWSYSHWL